MTTGVIAVTGATGGVGGRVARQLARLDVEQRLIVRDPDRAPQVDGAGVGVADYADRDAVRAAVAGADTLLFVSASEHPDRSGLHRGVVDAVVDAGIRRIVYLSFLAAAADATFTFARDHFFTEQHIRGSGVDFTFLRDSLYADYVPLMCGDDGVIRGPAGDGAVAVVTRDDVADVAAAVLTTEGHSGRTYDVTGPALLTFHDMAQALSAITGREVAYHAETMDEARASRARYGAPAWEVEGWITSYAAVATGELAVVSDAVETLTGHPPQSLEAFLRDNPAASAHLRPQ